MQVIANPLYSPSVEQKEDKNMVVTWNQFEVKCLQLSMKIELSGWMPKSILKIVRGGDEVGNAISRYFHIRCGSYVCKSYEAEGECVGVELKTAENATHIGELEEPVLIVDDLADKGHTLKATREFIKTRYKIENVRTAVLYCKTKTEYLPDYYIDLVPHDVWIFLPNEIYERIDTIKLSQEDKIRLRDNPELIARLLENLPSNPRNKMSLEYASELINQ